MGPLPFRSSSIDWWRDVSTDRIPCPSTFAQLVPAGLTSGDTRPSSRINDGQMFAFDPIPLNDAMGSLRGPNLRWPVRVRLATGDCSPSLAWQSGRWWGTFGTCSATMSVDTDETHSTEGERHWSPSSDENVPRPSWFLHLQQNASSRRISEELCHLRLLSIFESLEIQRKGLFSDDMIVLHTVSPVSSQSFLNCTNEYPTQWTLKMSLITPISTLPMILRLANWTIRLTFLYLGRNRVSRTGTCFTRVENLFSFIFLYDLCRSRKQKQLCDAATKSNRTFFCLDQSF